MRTHPDTHRHVQPYATDAWLVERAAVAARVVVASVEAPKVEATALDEAAEVLAATTEAVLEVTVAAGEAVGAAEGGGVAGEGLGVGGNDGSGEAVPGEGVGGCVAMGGVVPPPLAM